MQTSLVYPKERTLLAILGVMAAIAWLLIVVGTFGIALLYVLAFFVAYLFIHSAVISYIKGTAVRITPQQFPALHERIHQCAQKVGMASQPEAYLLRTDGIFNAFATKFLGRNYIALFAELVDALEDRPEALNFYIGHELGHLHRKHLSVAPLLTPVIWLPLIGPAYSRAREYSCDRYGLMCCASPADAAYAITVLASGGKHAAILNQDAYVGQHLESSGFWMSFHELVGDYPWLVKRLHAVRELGAGREPRMPGRHPFAWFFAFFTPRSGVSGGGAGMIMMVAIIGVLAAIAVPQFQQYQIKAKSQGFLTDGRNMATILRATANTVDDANNELAALKDNARSHAVALAASNITFGADGIVELHATDVALKAATVRFTPESSDDNSVTWHCQMAEQGALTGQAPAWCN